jgi:hypothetical protein
MSKLIVPTARPRNPLVAAARFRRAGQHGGNPGAERRDGRHTLRRELDQLELPRAMRDKPPGL